MAESGRGGGTVKPRKPTLSAVEKARLKMGTMAQNSAGRGSVSYLYANGGDGFTGKSNPKGGKGSSDPYNRAYGNVGNGDNSGYYPKKPGKGPVQKKPVGKR